MSDTPSEKAAAARKARAEEQLGESPLVVPSRSGITTPEEEAHQVSDLIVAAPAIFGCPSEEMAGAAHNAGWEMTAQVSTADAQVALKRYRELPV